MSRGSRRIWVGMAISGSESQIPYNVEQVLRRWFSKNLKTAFEFNCDSFNGTLWSLWSLLQLWSVVLLLALLWHMCLTMARPHQTERRKLEASNVAVNLGFGNIKVCQFCQPPRFCRLHWMALPNRHPTHQPPVISPSSARHQPVISPHGSLPRTVSPSTSGLDVTRAVIASARPWATSPRQPKQIRLQWQGTFTRFGLFCIALLYFGNGSQLFKTVSLYLWWSPSICFTTKSDWRVQYQVDCARQRSGRQLQGVRRHSAGLVGEWLPSGKIVLWG